MAITKLQSSALFKICDVQTLKFETTADLDGPDEVIGQPRAVEAIKFGIGIRRKGYNLFAFGPAGSGKRTLAQRYAQQQAATEELPPDWCYINNFQQADKPHLLRLPPGWGVELQQEMVHLVDDLHDAIPASFDTKEYRTRTQAIEDEINGQHEKALKEIHDTADQKGIGLIQTPTGFTLAPVREGKTLRLDEYEKLSEAERNRIEADSEELQQMLTAALHELPKLQKQVRDRISKLNREISGVTVAHLIEPLREKYADLPDVTSFINALHDDVINNFRHFLRKDENKESFFGLGGELSGKQDWMPWENRYKVNVLVGHQNHDAAPVIYEDLPSYNNLIGRVEHQALMGALVTDFTMIRSGALHRANGGYLILDALKILIQPFAWEGLKRALQAGEIRIESLAQLTSLISTVSVQPEPVPLDIKIILLGERHIYYLMSHLDPEFRELFKVAVDFSDRMNRDDETQYSYARLIAGIVRKENLKQFDRGAVAQTIEHSARLLGDSEKLATHLSSLTDLLQEADYWAQQREAKIVECQDVQKAIETRDYRMDQAREVVHEQIRRGTLLIDMQGSRVGCINGLSVLMAGDFWFARPSRITASVRVGENNVVDIEREVELGGPIHSKGVFILSAYIASHFVQDKPLALAASLVFEQSYGEIEGDSASSAELYALLSALANVPLKQSFAVTGSVNQQGEIQPIGAVNEKIEGFFDVCSQHGLSGEQGVIIPASNVKHLMLRKDVRDAVAAGKFSIHAVDTVDDGIELLTGMSAGERGDDGLFPENTVNRLVEDTLIRYAELMRDFFKPREANNTEQSS